MVLGNTHILRSEELVYVGDEPLCGITKVDRVLSFKLTDDLFGKDIVKSLKLGSAAANVNRNILAYLLHNTVTERDTKVFYQIFVQLFQTSLVSLR